MTESALSSAVACPTESAILRTLLYFEIFSYPLTAGEVFEYLVSAPALSKQQKSPLEILEKLEELVEAGRVYKFDSFYQTQQEPEWSSQRIDCNRRADEFLPIARRMSRFINAFPFIRAVFVSGSLSKHCMNVDSDIDFFLITAPGRLWLARTLLVLFKKIFLFNSHKYFCVNYFIDTEHLEIEEKNLYTAIETVTLLPLQGMDRYRHFCTANAWAWQYCPNFSSRTTVEKSPRRPSVLKVFGEWLLKGRMGTWLDVQAMRLTVAYWRRKFSHFDPETFDNALKSRRYVSKHHPLYFQKKVLEAHEALMRRLKV